MTLDVKAISDSMERGKVKEQNRVPEKKNICMQEKNIFKSNTMLFENSIKAQ